MSWAYVIGYGFSVFAEAIIVKSVVETLWDCISPAVPSSPRVPVHIWQGDALARIEGVLYVAALQLGLGYFIAAWLILKVGGQWKRWADEGNPETQRPDGRAVFHVFLIGNALTLIYSFVGFKLIGWVLANELSLIIWVSLAVIVGTLAFWLSLPTRPKLS